MKKIFIISTILVTGLLVSACKEKHHHKHDDEHSSVQLIVVQEESGLALEMKSHRDALFAEGKKEPPALSEVEQRLGDLIGFDEASCALEDKQAGSEKKGHHEIFILSAKVACENPPEKIVFSFDKVYPSIKQVHVSFAGDGESQKQTVESSGSVALPRENN